MVYLKSVKKVVVSLGLLATLLAALTLIYNTSSVSTKIALAAPDFGSNVIIFDPAMPVSQIQTTIDAITAQQVNSEMGNQRYALLFKPGTYGTQATPLNFQIGYYTEVAGLGQSPTDVVINGRIEVYNRCLDNNGTSNCLALVNFWRSLSNLTINVATSPDGCRGNTNFWAVSQAAPMRRVNINGNFSLMDYCGPGPQFASGGYMADTQISDDEIVSGSQQQFLVRDSKIGGWSNGVWNMVFAGVVGAPANSFTTSNSIAQPYTTLPADPVSREKPYLFMDGAGDYNVFVPAPRVNSVGTSWTNGPTPGIAISINSFFVAKPTDSAATINAALAGGKHLILTPGIYQLDATIQIPNANTIVLGLGLATLIPNNGVVAMSVADVPGVIIAGVLFDAGPVNSPVLLQVGATPGSGGSSSNPTMIQDVFFRIGGAATGKATTSLVVNTNYAILDHIWAWRADHGIGGVGWTVNTADTGVIVNGNDVLAIGLFVEHYQKHQVIWNGENGKTIFFQSEMPYDPPNQAAFSHDGILGYASYKVADHVQNHEAWGLGSYCFFNVDPTIHAAHGFEVPDRYGIRFHSMVTVSLNYQGIIDHVINNTGPVTPPNTGSVNLVHYIASSLNLTATPNPAQPGQAVTFTATVTPITATGTITFSFNGTTEITGTLVNGVATYMTDTLPTGFYTVTATYSGDAEFIGNKATLTQNICTPLVVTSTTDNGQGNLCGTLSYALLSASSGTTITFALTQGNMITFSGALTPTVKAGVGIDGGAGPNSLVLNGNSIVGNNLVLSGNNILRNLTIQGFGLKANPGPNSSKLYYVRVSKTS